MLHSPLLANGLGVDMLNNNTGNKMSVKGSDNPGSRGNKSSSHEDPKNHSHSNTAELWTDGLICAFEYVRVRRKGTKSKSPLKLLPHQGKEDSGKQLSECRSADSFSPNRKFSKETTMLADEQRLVSQTEDQLPENHWVPIGWKRVSELVQTVQIDADWGSQQFDFMDDEDDVTIAELAAPYWERPAGPVWWCHFDASHHNIISWLSNSQWLHPAISIALRDESRLISEKMKYLLYEVPVRVAGGLLFELLGQSAGDPYDDEDDIPIVIRSWQHQNFLVTAMHIKGSSPKINVLGVMEVQELLIAGGHHAARSVHDIIAHLTCRLARWDDRLFRKTTFGAADEVELKFMNRRNHEDMNLLAVILNQEITKLSRQVIRVKWTLHAREEIVFELLQHLKGPTAKGLLEGIMKSTREMVEEQEAVRGRLFTIQDVMQGTVRAWLQDKSLRVTHNLGVIGGCGLVLTILTGLFGINVDGIPGSDNTPYAFWLFTGLLCLLGIILIGVGMIYLGLKQPVSDEQVQVRKLELDDLVKMFQHEAETHAQVRQDKDKKVRSRLRQIAQNNILPNGADYVIIE